MPKQAAFFKGLHARFTCNKNSCKNIRSAYTTNFSVYPTLFIS